LTPITAAPAAYVPNRVNAKIEAIRVFIKALFQRIATPASPADIDVEGSRLYGKPKDYHSFQIVQIDTLFGLNAA
jgi:hypothetical protein